MTDSLASKFSVPVQFSNTAPWSKSIKVQNPLHPEKRKEKIRYLFAHTHPITILYPNEPGASSTPYLDPSFLYLPASTLATTMGVARPANTGATSSIDPFIHSSVRIGNPNSFIQFFPCSFDPMEEVVHASLYIFRCSCSN
jgi:hypothetical protein